jgi:hypothetical protein
LLDEIERQGILSRYGRNTQREVDRHALTRMYDVTREVMGRPDFRSTEHEQVHALALGVVQRPDFLAGVLEQDPSAEDRLGWETFGDIVVQVGGPVLGRSRAPTE